MAHSTNIDYKGDASTGLAVRVTELEAGTATIAGPIRVPKVGTIKRYTAELVSGTGATIDPVVSRDPAPADNTIDTVAGGIATAAAYISDAQGIPYYAPDGELYIKAGANAGSDNVIEHELLIVAGW